MDHIAGRPSFETQVNSLVENIEVAVFGATGTHVFRDGRDGSYSDAGSAIALRIDEALRTAGADTSDVEWGFGSSMLNGDVIPIATEQAARVIHKQSHRLIPVYHRAAAGPWVLDNKPTGMIL